MIGSLCCLYLFWLARMITLVLAFGPSVENRSKLNCFPYYLIHSITAGSVEAFSVLRAPLNELPCLLCRDIPGRVYDEFATSVTPPFWKRHDNAVDETLYVGTMAWQLSNVTTQLVKHLVPARWRDVRRDNSAARTLYETWCDNFQNFYKPTFLI